MPDYATLKLAWWALIVVLLIGFAVMDGFDLGVAMLLPFVGRTDDERRVAINTVGPTWEGNQVWLVLAGGAIFAAWPLVYAAGFSVFYVALIATLCTLFLRPVGFDYRSKLTDRRWRSFWDWGLFTGGFVPSLVFGVAVGNLFLGVPFQFDDSLRLAYGGGILQQLNPFSLFCGVVSVVMLALHGGAYLMLRTDERVWDRARHVVVASGVGLAILFVLGGLWIAHLDGYLVAAQGDVGTALSPLGKSVTRAPGAWLRNYDRWQWLRIVPALGIAGALGASVGAWRGWRRPTFIATAATVAGVIATAGASLFPFVLPSNMDARSSLTAWDAVSSSATLWAMLIVTAILLPLVLIYTAWVYRVLRGPVTVQAIRRDTHSAY